MEHATRVLSVFATAYARTEPLRAAHAATPPSQDRTDFDQQVRNMATVHALQLANQQLMATISHLVMQSSRKHAITMPLARDSTALRMAHERAVTGNRAVASMVWSQYEIDVWLNYVTCMRHSDDNLSVAMPDAPSFLLLDKMLQKALRSTVDARHCLLPACKSDMRNTMNGQDVAYDFDRATEIKNTPSCLLAKAIDDVKFCLTLRRAADGDLKLTIDLYMNATLAMDDVRREGWVAAGRSVVPASLAAC